MPHSIIIQCPEHVKNVHTFADTQGVSQAFATALGRLMVLIAGYTAEAEKRGGFLKGTIWKDWAPHSFNWVAVLVDADGREVLPVQVFLGGGLVYHGPTDRGAGEEPNLSVLLERDMKLKHIWTIHT